MAKKQTIKTATPEEREAYRNQKPRPCYPLLGWYTVEGHRCAVEDLSGDWGKEDPQLEIMAPEGFHFEMNGTHSLLAHTRKDLYERCASERFATCTEACC
jgi:hypothetical protein